MSNVGAGASLSWLPFWGTLSLAKQFALASLLVISLGMLGLGYLINSQIREGVINHTASTTALYMESFVEPLAQDMESHKIFSAETNKAFDNLMTGPLKGKLISLKIWNLDATIAYSNFPELIGQRFEIDDSLAEAFRGNLTAELGYIDAAENVKEREINIQLLEVYSPLYQLKTGKLIGVGEFYLNSDALMMDLWHKTILTWCVVAAFTLSMVGILSAIMFRASSTIGQQRLQLNEQVSDLSKLLESNNQLSNSIKLANEKAVVLNDQLLTRLGSDLHDGPAQLLSFALLCLSGIAAPGKKNPANQVEKLKGALEDALNEIRMISSGLNMPQLESYSLEDVLKLAVSNHERMTRTKVKLKVDNFALKASSTLKACLYRVVQEGLTNAFKHGAGIGQHVTLHHSNNALVIEVSDKGKGFDWNPHKDSTDHLGLVGLQNRVRVFGGTVTIVSARGEGCSLTATIPIHGEVVLLPETLKTAG